MTGIPKSGCLAPYPTEYLTLNGKLRLYTLRDCADQLRRIHGISIYIVNRTRLDTVYMDPQEGSCDHTP